MRTAYREIILALTISALQDVDYDLWNATVLS